MKKRFRYCYKLVSHWLFNFLIFIAIILNSVSIALENWQNNEMEEFVLTVINIFWTLVFTFEAIFKIAGFGLRNYIKDGFNIFDCTIVVFSLVDFVISI